MKKILLLLSFSIISHAGFCTTWDEPWAEKVIAGAQSFVLAKITRVDPEKGISLRIIRNISGQELKDTLTITGYYALRLCSSSGDGVGYHVQQVDSCFFFISKKANGEYSIATPTTGYDYVLENNVISTFRHSYHQASVPFAIYEKTMTTVFNHYHQLPYDTAFIRQYVIEHLSKKPAGFTEEEVSEFFLQHVALECIYHLKLPVAETLPLPFFNDPNNFHHQVSAARALSAFNTTTNRAVLLKAIADTSRRGFVRVMCVWSLANFHPTELKAQLQKLADSSSDESDGFGGNIMDPRICTHMPSVREALKTLIAKLNKT